MNSMQTSGGGAIGDKDLDEMHVSNSRQVQLDVCYYNCCCGVEAIGDLYV